MMYLLQLTTLISSLPGPAVPEGGSQWDYVTNGVSVSDNGWVYIANGAGGLDVAKLDSEGQLTWMGNIDLEHQSILSKLMVILSLLPAVYWD